MFFKNKNNIVKSNISNGPIQILTETAETIADCGREIQENAENIMLSCQIMPGTKGEAHKDLLLSKAEGMEKLAVLYNSASRRYMKAAEELADGAPEDKILSDVFAYSTFFDDQLESEEKDANHILSILREECRENYS